MRTRCVLLVFVSLSVLLLGSCNFGSQGADFDPTQYYTKSNINSWMQGALPTYANSANMDASVTTGETSYAAGAVLPGAIPTGAIGALVTATSTVSTILHLGDSPIHEVGYYLVAGVPQMFYYTFRPGATAYTTTPKWWTDANASVLIRCNLFFFDWSNGQP